MPFKNLSALLTKFNLNMYCEEQQVSTNCGEGCS